MNSTSKGFRLWMMNDDSAAWLLLTNDDDDNGENGIRRVSCMWMGDAGVVIFVLHLIGVGNTVSTSSDGKQAHNSQTQLAPQETARVFIVIKRRVCNLLCQGMPAKSGSFVSKNICATRILNGIHKVLRKTNRAPYHRDATGCHLDTSFEHVPIAVFIQTSKRPQTWKLGIRKPG